MKKTILKIYLLTILFCFIGCKLSVGTKPKAKTGGSSGGQEEIKPTYIGTKAPTEAKVVGDVVFNDGSATPYTAGMTFTEDQKNAAIALIFYKGTGLNNGNDTTTSRTLGVGLKHNQIGLRWCSDDADANKKNITTIQCSVEYSADRLIISGVKNGKNNLKQIGEFEGVNDTKTKEKYPAFYFAKNYKDITGSNVSDTDYEEDWYLPSIAELYKIYACRADTRNGFNVDAASDALGGNQFGDFPYWSSTQDSSVSQYAFEFQFDSGNVCPRVKSNYYEGVCCIREFN